MNKPIITAPVTDLLWRAKQAIKSGYNTVEVDTKALMEALEQLDELDELREENEELNYKLEEVEQALFEEQNQ